MGKGKRKRGPHRRGKKSAEGNSPPSLSRHRKKKKRKDVPSDIEGRRKDQREGGRGFSTAQSARGGSAAWRKKKGKGKTPASPQPTPIGKRRGQGNRFDHS